MAKNRFLPNLMAIGIDFFIGLYANKGPDNQELDSDSFPSKLTDSDVISA